MKMPLLCLLALLALSGKGNGSESDKYQGYWSFSDSWSGYMGAALEIKGDAFRYWFYSDLKTDKDPQYPIEGKIEVLNGVLTLKTDKQVYATQWYLVERDNQIFGIFPLSNLAVVHFRNEHVSERMMALVSRDTQPIGWPIMNAAIPTLPKAP